MSMEQLYYEFKPKLRQLVFITNNIAGILTIYSHFNMDIKNYTIILLILFVILLVLYFLIPKRDYVDSSWIGAGDGDEVDAEEVYDPVQTAPRKRIPCFRLENKIILVMKWLHKYAGWWAACIAINPNWRPEDLSKYEILEFNIKGSGKENDDTKLGIRLEDAELNNLPFGAHNSTNWIEISAGPNWRSDPIRIRLQEFDWTKEAFPNNGAEPNRKNILQITFGCDNNKVASKSWKTAMIKDIAFIKEDGSKRLIDFHVKTNKIKLPFYQKIRQKG